MLNPRSIRSMGGLVQVSPVYALRMLPGSHPHIYLRRTVLDRLYQAAAVLLTANLGLMVWDGWRPVRVQQALYDDFRLSLQRSRPDLGEVELSREVEQFVARPSADRRFPSPHYSGGAVDLTLIDTYGQPLPMGTPFDDFSPLAATRYFEDLSLQRPLQAEEQICLENRRLLFHTMAQRGFTVYGGEWWHYDLGNQRWAAVTKQTACYGAIEPEREP